MKDLFIISHTHWDREWYRTRQQYRLQLLQMMDRLLDLMGRVPEFKHFLLDGQVIMLEDYLELRPERLGDVRRLVSEGRLQIGPWYVQPDEFLVSGEALIRNLLAGAQAGQALGGVVKIGWLPDTFGHVAQLPQILRNFAIDNVEISRGLGDQTLTCPSLFWWAAPDGSRVLVLHQIGGYWNASNLGHASFWGDTAGSAADVEVARRTLLHLLPELDPDGVLPALVVWNGADHMPPQGDLPQLIESLGGQVGAYRLRLGSLPDYLSVVSPDRLPLTTVTGELRASRYQALLPATLSTRIYLKQANQRAQSLLTCYAEPLSALNWVLGDAYPVAELREAWQLLLQNHAHDSLCGCGIDPVHSEMTVRFDQVQQIGQDLVGRSLDALARRVAAAGWGPGRLPVLIFNPLARPRLDSADVTLRLPECPRAFRVVDAQGHTGAVQVLTCERELYDWIPPQATVREIGQGIAFWRENLRDLYGVDIIRCEWQSAGQLASLRLLLGERYWASEETVAQLTAELAQLPADTPVRLEAACDAVHLTLRANIPALGYAAVAVEGCDRQSDAASSLVCGPRAVENETLRVEVEPDGGLTLLCKETGRQYQGLHRFVDEGDAGDTYDFCPVPGSEPTLLRGAPEVTLIESGPLQAALRIEHRFEIPAAVAADRRARSDRCVVLPVNSVIRLRADSPYLEVTTTLENQARDHRLRLHFPTGISSEIVHADGHMAVVSRPVQTPVGSGWVQPPSGLNHHQSWFAVDDGIDGLAILSQGLHEHEALAGESGVTLALTLMRSVGWLSRGDLSTRNGHAGPSLPTPEAQCLGSHTFRCGLLPYAGAVSRQSLPQLAAAFDSPLLASPMPSRPGRLPPQLGFIALEPGELVFSTMKCSETGDRLVLRYYNAVPSRVKGRLRLGFAATEVWRATAGEQAIRRVDLEADGRGCIIEAEANEIATLLLVPARATART